MIAFGGVFSAMRTLPGGNFRMAVNLELDDGQEFENGLAASKCPDSDHGNLCETWMNGKKGGDIIPRWFN